MKKIWGKALWMFLFCFLCWGITAEAAVTDVGNEIRRIELMDYVETVYDSTNKMITSEANTVMQTSDGYIWIGSYGGLVRFSGEKFENISTQREGAPKNGIRVLFEDSQKRLWIGTNDSGIYVFDQEKFTKIESEDDQVEHLSVRTISEDQQGDIYIGTTMGLFCLNEEKGLEKIADERIKGRTIENLICDKEGYMWGLTGDGSLFVVKEEELVFTSAADMEEFVLHKGMMQASSGNIYIGTEGNKILRITFEGAEFLQGKYEVEVLSVGNCKTVNDIYEDTEGKIWICSDEGIGYFDNEDVFHEVYGLTFDAMMDKIWQDYEGNLWFASSRRGVLELSRSKFKNIGYEAGVENQTVNTTILYRRKLYIGTDSELSIMDENGVRVENALTNELQGVRIRNFMQDSKGNLWISTYREKGLICYNEESGQWFSLLEEDGLPTEKIRMTLELQNGDVAVATNGGVAIVRDGKVVKVYGNNEGIQNERILCMVQQTDGTLLAGSDGNGIYTIDLETDKIENVSTEDGLTSGVVLSMTLDKETGVIWISNGNALSVKDADGIRTVSAVPESSGSVFDINIRGDELWILKSEGVIRMKREDLLADNPTYEMMGSEDGLSSSITANSWNYLSKDGMLFLCTGNGVFYLNTKDIYRNRAIPKIAVSSIQVDDKIYYGAQDIVIPAKNNKMTISLELLSYGFAEGSMQYYLEGFDKAPTQIRKGEDSTVNYTNLPGGIYTFHLTGCNSDGVESEEITFRIEKERSIYEKQYRNALITIAGLLVISLIMLAVQYANKRNILKKQQEYRSITEQAVQMVARTIDAKDKYTNGHSRRVAAYSVEIGRRYGLDEEQLEHLYYGALLHDIGKIGVPDSILNKSGKLTDEEFEKIKEHPRTGGKILKDFKLVPWLSVGAEYHHERYDGRGYCKGLKGETIPLHARIISVADAYDCMNSTRVYRPSMTEEVILSEIEKGRGTQFDPDFAEIMLEMIREGFKAE